MTDSNCQTKQDDKLDAAIAADFKELGYGG
jgi:hypothetical protein